MFLKTMNLLARGFIRVAVFFSKWCSWCLCF